MESKSAVALRALRRLPASSLLASLSTLLLAGAAGCSLYVEQPPPDESPPGDTQPGYPPGYPDEPPPPDIPPLPPGGIIEPSPLRGTADGGNAEGAHSCLDQYAHYEHGLGSRDEVALHVVGIHTSLRRAEDSRDGLVDVRVVRPGPSVLVLSAYESTHWNVEVAPGATVTRIILAGFHAHSVSAPEGAEIEYLSLNQNWGYFGDIGYDWPSYRTTRLVDDAESYTGLTLTSFRGCYDGDSFEIATPSEIRPPHPVSDSDTAAVPAGCEHLARESQHCITADMAVIGLDSGEVCLGAPGGIGLSAVDATSLGWQGDYLYSCVQDRGVARISIVDGTVDVAPIQCEAVSTDGDGLLVMLPPGAYTSQGFSLVRFDSFEAAARREVSRLFDVDPYASRVALHGTRGYFAWHSTDTVEIADLDADVSLRSIQLEGYDDWIYGMDVTDDGRLLVLGPFYNAGLHVFDADTGAALGRIAPELSGLGLACAPGRAE